MINLGNGSLTLKLKMVPS